MFDPLQLSPRDEKRDNSTEVSTKRPITLIGQFLVNNYRAQFSRIIDQSSYEQLVYKMSEAKPLNERRQESTVNKAQYSLQ